VLFGLTRMLIYILLTFAIGKYSWDAVVSGFGRDNFDCQVNEINPDTAQRWEDLKILVHGTKISPENLIYFGSPRRRQRIKKLDIRNYKGRSTF
jgi:hypothetical protein